MKKESLSKITRCLSRTFLYDFKLFRIITESFRRSCAKSNRNVDSKVIITDFDGDLKMTLDVCEFMGSLIYWNGYNSKNELELINKYLNKNILFLFKYLLMN